MSARRPCAFAWTARCARCTSGRAAPSVSVRRSGAPTSSGPTHGGPHPASPATARLPSIGSVSAASADAITRGSSAAICRALASEPDLLLLDESNPRGVAFLLVMAIIAALQIFDQPYVLTRGGPGDSTRTVVGAGGVGGRGGLPSCPVW